MLNFDTIIYENQKMILLVCLCAPSASALLLGVFCAHLRTLSCGAADDGRAAGGGGGAEGETGDNDDVDDDEDDGVRRRGEGRGDDWGAGAGGSPWLV